ncbi:Fatty acid-binding protein type 2 [Fasciola gigantica]|uniref:Fatty acid-binding protein type 2 n=1 Tax=Fasciola gigantica TaxID=46835 RepID=A0A504YL75_FASGI|nr:Fatty acid-binding protein type 2 [Fasciola gigantica]
MANFVGSWKLVHTENMDALLQNLGINSVKRKFITSSKPEITFTLEGNTMHMKTASPLKTVTTVTKDSDNKISQVQKSPKNTTQIVREIIHNKMIVTQTHCQRI